MPPKSKLTITQGKDGLFHARIFSPADADGKRTSKRITGHSEADVQRQADEYFAEMKRQPQAFRMTLREACDRYLDYLANKKKPLSPSTLRLYSGIARTYLTSLHDIPLISITEEMIQNEIYGLEMKVSAKTIHNIINFYVPCIKHSRRGFRPELDLPDLQKPVTKVPDMAVLKEKINSIDNIRLKIPVLLASYCGMRRSEIAALDLSADVEYDKVMHIGEDAHTVCIIHITKAMVMDPDGNYVIKSTKSEAGERDLFIPSWLGDILKEARDSNEYVPYPPHKISSRFYEWAEREEIGCSFHGLRHFYASIMKALNIPDNYAMLLMGHSTDNMLQRYQEIMNEKELEVNRDLLVYLENNQPIAPHFAPQENVNRENERKIYK